MPSASDCALLLLDAIPGLMRGLHGMMRRRGGLADDPLTPGQLRLMDMLGGKPRTLGELAAVQHVAPSTVSRSIDLLVRREWVTRRSNPGDRRQVILGLSDAGRAAHLATAAHIQDALVQLVEQLNDDERARLYDGMCVLQKLIDRVGDALPPDQESYAARNA